MTRPVSVIVRKDKKSGKYYAGFASQFPLREGFEDVDWYGDWYGSQMNYRPYNTAYRSAQAEADDLNAENDCKALGKIYVRGYLRDDDVYVKGHCRER